MIQKKIKLINKAQKWMEDMILAETLSFDLKNHHENRTKPKMYKAG